MSSYFTVASTANKNPPIQKQKDQENDDIEIIEEKKENKSDEKVDKIKTDDSFEIKTNVKVLRELPVCHPAKKINDGIKDISTITVKSPIKSNPKDKLNDSQADMFSSNDEIMQDDSPGSSKRKRNASNVSENIDEDLNFLAQLDDLDFSLLDK